MASVPELAEISMEGLSPEQVETLNPVADVYNSFNEQVVTALNKNLTFSENFRAEIKTVSMRTTDRPTVATSITQPRGLWVIGFKNTTNPSTMPTQAPYLDWAWDGRSAINIKQILGITGNDTYEVTFLIIAG